MTAYIEVPSSPGRAKPPVTFFNLFTFLERHPWSVKIDKIGSDFEVCLREFPKRTFIQHVAPVLLSGAENPASAKSKKSSAIIPTQERMRKKFRNKGL